MQDAAEWNRNGYIVYSCIIEPVMEERIIFHCDVNSAFLSWSAVKRLKEDPDAVDLRTIPSAVGGDVETRHGVITARSIPAKRYGVTTGEPVVKALQKCPNLVLVPSDFKIYRAYSHAFMEILHEYSDEVQQASIDEAWVDMTEAVDLELRRQQAHQSRMGRQTTKVTNRTAAVKTSGHHHMAAENLAVLRRDTAVLLAGRIREEVRTKLSFTINVGISSNKLLAKMASDFQKPDRTHTLWPEEIPEKMWPLPIDSLYGCGQKTAERLKSLGIRTIGEAAAAETKVLQSFLGEKGGEYISQAARGLGSSTVQTEREDAKSYSNELTTSEDVTQNNYRELALPLVAQLSESVSGRLKRDGVYGSTVTVSVKTDDFRRHSRQTRLTSSTNEKNVIEQNADRLMESLLFEENGIFDRGLAVRLIGVGVSTLDRGEYRQLDLAGFLREQEEERVRQEQEKEAEKERARQEQQRQEQKREAEEKRRQESVKKEQQEKQKRLHEMMEKLQKRYGQDSIRKGSK